MSVATTNLKLTKGNQMQIEIITPAGLSQMLPYTDGNLKWAKRLFEQGLLQSWEIIK